MSTNVTRYPLLEVDLKKFRENIDCMTKLCQDKGIDVAGVIKGFHAIPEMVKEFDKSACKYIASSRMEQIIDAKEDGCEKPFFLIRLPMLSEVADLVKYVDYSLNSERTVLDKINEECQKQGKRHGVVLMVDLGDLREGFWDETELIDTARYVDSQLDAIDLLGIGTNLGCYGSIKATPEKMNDLICLAEKIEAVIGRRLDIISGGGTTSAIMVFDDTMPERINHLRIGEGIILAHDYESLFGVKADFLNQDVFTLKAQIIEVKDKPSYPVGELSFDAFGHVQTYEDRGIRRRALAALGKVDFGDPEMLIPKNDKLEILGASSDHLILDVENCKDDINVGDIVEFDLCYATMVYLTSSKNVHIVAK
ncbi:alanine/ornithine racemase family PLP-dependent enzyme [Aminipila butyrica]|uniref:Alanine/ornithine racemase family PLP-dependent enzyme n=1 Tax=Aminipila butyrica TaxID=433296 RepID=A0A858BWG8_9FIRM|nr:alanine/ornithine racemase family PLP-dependent enzyme [Aminipila butyrica]QIB70421.1 alanine/ornithine racemase family PLP-dependent enzyme [Aminipila butyrica]